MPLLAEIGRGNDEYTPLALRPSLGNHEASLNGLTEPYLVSKQRPFCKRRRKGKKGCIYLVRVHVDLRTSYSYSQTVCAVRRTTAC